MLELRRADGGTRGQVLALMPQYYAHDHLVFDPEKAENALRILLEDSRLGEVWLLYWSEREDPIGYLIIAHGFSLECAGVEAFVDELFVLPEFRGKGFGGRAIRHAIERCKENDVKLLRLEVTSHNPDAARLYKKLGFEDWGRTLLSYPISQ